jgi:hypothetical protein
MWGHTRPSFAFSLTAHQQAEALKHLEAGESTRDDRQAARRVSRHGRQVGRVIDAIGCVIRAKLVPFSRT